MFRATISIVFLFVLCFYDLVGSNPIAVTKFNRIIRVSEMGQFIDSTSSLTYHDFLMKPKSIFASSENYLGTRNKDFTYWLTFSLQGELLQEEIFYFICSDKRISHMEMWIDGEPQTADPIGTSYLFDNRNINHRNLVYRLPEKDHLELVIKIKSNQSAFFAFEVKEENRFFKDSFWESMMLGCAYGIIILSLFFSLIMQLRFRDSIYGVFAFFSIVSIVTCLHMDGSGFQYIWKNTPSVNLILLLSLPIPILFSIGALVLSFLDAWEKGNKYLKIIGSSLLISPIGYVFVFTVPQYYIHNIFYFTPFVAMIYCCLAKFWDGHKSILPFILGFIFVLFSNVAFLLQPCFSVEYFQPIIQFVPHLGIVALILSLSYSQYTKFFFISESRNKERKKSIDHLEQLNEIKDRINEEIAEKVALQTMELERKNSIIHQQNAEMQLANDKLKEQTDEIVILNQKLNEENQELKSDVQKMTESRILQNTITFDDFKEYFNTEESCYNLLEELKWQNGFQCAKCGNTKFGKGKGERAKRCTKCGINDSVTSNTIFHRIHFPILKGFFILFLINKHGDNLISKDLSEIVELRLATCWKFSKKIKARKAELEQSGKVIESWMDLI